MKIKRSIFNSLELELRNREVVILLGARQVGKSTLMANLLKTAQKDKRTVQVYDLEQPADLLKFSKTSLDLFNDLTKEHDALIFIDEFHYLKNASKLFKAIYDFNKNIKIVVSGSSSLEIHKHLKESLAGRRKVFNIYPLTWVEYKQTQKSLDDYLVYGGMPGLIKIKEKTARVEYLSQILKTYIIKDIKGLIKEENIRAFNHILYFLAENQGQIIPTSNLAREVRMTSKSIENYLVILEQTFIAYGLHSFSRKLSNELKKSKKYYFFDNGIRNTLVKNFQNLDLREDQGCLYESYIFLELHKRLRANIDLRFWRTKKGDEVDFIWIENRQPIPIEVKTTFSQKNPPKGLLKFMKAYPNTKYGVVFNKKISQDFEIEGVTIKVRKFEEVEELLNEM